MRAEALLVLLAACDTGGLPIRKDPSHTMPADTASDTTPTDPTVDTGAPPTTGDTGASTTPGPTLVAVAHERELRGVWVATVSNINWPSAQGLSVATQQAEMRDILDVCADAGLNAVFWQVRPEADAMYASAIEPWSRYLTGTQGVDPGWDPLDYLVTEGHARGLEGPRLAQPVPRQGELHLGRRQQPRLRGVRPVRLPLRQRRLARPGRPAIQDQLEAVVSDLALRYDIDGIHFDDYFYPYPDGTAFPDSATYAAYGGGLSLADWRRDNVNQMMQRVGAAVAGVDPAVRFGIGPFGIYRPGQPPGITGLDQYAELYADPPLWKAAGYVDYLAPQLYWPTTQTAQAYEPLLDWWAEPPADGRYTFPGNALYQLGTTGAWDVDELRDQVALTRGRADAAALGNIWYNVSKLQTNDQGIRDVFRDEFYPTPALPPPVFDQQDVAVDPPDVVPDGDGVIVSHPDARWWVVYAEDGDGWAIDRIVPATEAHVALGAGRWAISAAAKHGVESLGVVVDGAT
ncbi:MAG: family 10 glycosylhydrolase [Myxococcota bacterium]